MGLLAGLAGTALAAVALAAQFSSAAEWLVPPYSGTPPAARSGHSSLVFGESSMIVFGGQIARVRYLNDIAIRNLDSKSWLKVSTSGTAPAPRTKHTAVEDGDFMIIFGGFNGQDLNDVAAYYVPTSTWALVGWRGSPPSPRSAHTAVTNGNGEMIVYGGFSGGLARNDVRQFDMRNDTWLPPNATSGTPPPPRGLHCAVWTKTDDMLIFGGRGNTLTPLNDLWRLVGSTLEWQQVMTTGDAPPGRSHLTGLMANTEGTDFLVIFGGRNDEQDTFYNDVWRIDAVGDNSWEQVVGDGSLPEPREGHSAVFYIDNEATSRDKRNARMIVFGGQTDTLRFSNNVHFLVFEDVGESAASTTSTSLAAALIATLGTALFAATA